MAKNPFHRVLQKGNGDPLEKSIHKNTEASLVEELRKICNPKTNTTLPTRSELVELADELLGPSPTPSDIAGPIMGKFFESESRQIPLVGKSGVDLFTPISDSEKAPGDL